MASTTSLLTYSCLMADIAHKTRLLDTSQCNPCASVAQQIDASLFEGVASAAILMDKASRRAVEQHLQRAHKDILCYYIRVLRDDIPMDAALPTHCIFATGAPMVVIETTRDIALTTSVLLWDEWQSVQREANERDVCRLALHAHLSALGRAHSFC